MITIDCAQGSPEWIAERMGKVTASNVNNILNLNGDLRTGETPRSYMYKLLAERLEGVPMQSHCSFEMQWGIDHEDEARKWYELDQDVSVKRVGFAFKDETRRAGASPDGLMNLKGLEIKCPQAHTAIKYVLDGVLPNDYLHQVQFSMWVCDMDFWDFVVYHPSPQIPNMVLTVAANRELHEKYDENIPAFCSELDEAEAKIRAMLPPVEEPQETPEQIKLGQEFDELFPPSEPQE